MMLVSVTGPIAAGATTLSERLADVMGWRTALEVSVEQENPFFSRYHQEPKRYAFHNQVTFLTQSAEGHEHLRTTAEPGAIYVQDFTPFEHTGVYAHVQRDCEILSPEEFGVVQRLSGVLEKSYITPTVLVFRHLDRTDLLARVQERARPSEQELSVDYLEAVRVQFDTWIGAWNRSPVVWVESSMDVKNDNAAVQQIGEKILTALQQ